MLLIAPCLLLGSLKAHLTGVPEEQMEAAPRFGELLSDHQHEGHWPVSLTDSLRDALAMATSGRLQEAVSIWTLRRRRRGARRGTGGRLPAADRPRGQRGLYCGMPL
jgi:hypothetical protein